MSNQKHILNRGMLWGMLMQNLEIARVALQGAKGRQELLDDEEQAILQQAINIVSGLEQRGWVAQSKEADKFKK